MPYHELLAGRSWPHGRPDLLVVFWWPTTERLVQVMRPRRVLVCLFDGYSTRLPPARAEFHRACSLGHIAVANRGFADRVLPGRAVSICEDAVDTGLFVPLPSPATFTVGWTGNSDGAGSAGGPPDLKGLGLIRAACQRAGVRLVTQDLAVDGHRAYRNMPAWYGGVSAYVCASECEGGPNPVLEALASGRPVVSTNVGLVSDLAAAGAPVSVVERSVGAIAQALRGLCGRRPEVVEAQSIEARRVALQHDRAAKIGQWREAFQTALETQHAPA